MTSKVLVFWLFLCVIIAWVMCVMVCTCWLCMHLCHGVYLLGYVCTCWLVCHGACVLVDWCVSWCGLVVLCVSWYVLVVSLNVHIRIYNPQCMYYYNS